MKMKKSAKLLLLSLGIAAALLAACDMTRIPDPSSGDSKGDGARYLSPEERDEYERTGRFLKLAHMPLNTQISNVSSAQVANSVSPIAKLDEDEDIRIFRDSDALTVYLPLVYSGGGEFTENGSFYVAFAIHVDAVTSYVVSHTDKVLVPFLEGRGALDVRTLPVSSPDSSVVIDDAERDELERTGRFLKLEHMPLNTQGANVVDVLISNSASSIAKLDQNSRISIYLEENSSTVYLPLVYDDGSEFVENGIFYIAFTIHVDAVTKYILLPSDNFLLPFTDGRGALDVRTLPYKGPTSVIWRYLTIFNLPPNMSPQNVSKVFVHNRNSPVAECADYSLIEVFTSGGKSSCSIPLKLSGSDLPFSGTGSFFVSFDLYIDAFVYYSVSPSDSVLVSFNGGSGYLNINDLPDADAAYSSWLAITNLPPNLIPQNISRVYVHNRYGPVAECADYSLVNVVQTGGKAAINIPLKFSGSDLPFSGTGSFFVSFDLYIDAFVYYSVSPSDSVLVSFAGGSGSLNIDNLPAAASPVYSLLTITNLPPNLSPQDISNVAVHNQAGEVASCKNYSLVESSLSGGYGVLKVPLFDANSQNFSETGSYFVSFDINIDAVTRFLITPKDRVQVLFTNGSGSLNINDLPVPVPPVYSYLTVTNLPPNLIPQNVSNVAVHNQTGQVASCTNYSLVDISLSGGKAVLKIPLFYANSQIFLGTGAYIVSFDINIDAVTRFLIAEDDRVQVLFTNGSGTLDILNIPEKTVPYLTIKGLPLNTTKKHISNINVYNMVQAVANCRNYDDIIILRQSLSATALIPLSDSSSDGYFHDSGMFRIVFTVNVDALTQYSYDLDSNLMLEFTEGSATYDLASSFGIFQAELVNPSDLAAPRIKAGSFFDIEGVIHRISEDLSIDALLPSTSGVLYLYAYRLNNSVVFEYSRSDPSFSPGKNGWYYGSKRALWKMLYLIDHGQKFLFKTYIGYNWQQFAKYLPEPLTGNNDTDVTQGFTAVYQLSGNANPAPATVTLEAGIYIVKLTGAGGAAGYRAYSTGVTNVSGASANGGRGGDGGAITEIISLGSSATFTAFTGSGGYSPPTPSPSQSGYNPKYSFQNGPHGPGRVYLGHSGTFYGGSGGGGGSGTFVFSSDGYLLCAGGGGGGSGGSLLSPGGGGGAGGSIGSGAGGGASGYFRQTFNDSNAYYQFAIIGIGGRGGGFSGGEGGRSSSSISEINGSNGGSVLSSSGFRFSGQSAPSYLASSITPVRTEMSHVISSNSGEGGATAYMQQYWQDTNNANGSGANAPTLRPTSTTTMNADDPGNGSASVLHFFPAVAGANGSSGGNNRNNSKGGGSTGGAAGATPTDGQAGSIAIYKIF